MKSPVILRVFKDNQLISVRQFDQDQIVVGSDSDAHLRLDGAGISAVHCTIEKREDGFYISDLGSQSGTFKNGQAVLDESIQGGDTLQIGPYKVVFFLGIPKPATESGVFSRPPSVDSTLRPNVSSPSAKVVPSIPTKSDLKESAKPAKINITKPTTDVQVRPSLRTSVLSKKSKKTFAPPSSIQDLRTYLKPNKGPIVEVLVAWKERVINSFHFSQRGIFRIGPSERFPIQIPDLTMSPGWPLLEISTGVRVSVSPDMFCELITTSGKKSLEDILRLGKGQRSGSATLVRLDQNEMLCLSLAGGRLQIFLRFVPQTPVVPMLPPLMFNSNELMGILSSILLVAIVAFYVSTMRPKEMPEDQQEEITRTAQIIFNKTENLSVPKPPEEKVDKNIVPPKPEKAQMSDKKTEVQKKGESVNKTQANSQQRQGRASEVAPNPTANTRPKKFTSAKSGGAIKLGKEAGANADSAKDITKMGLFSAFGGGGNRNKLDTAYKGANEILGQADKATGSSGMDANRAGEDLGSKFKDTGAGGKGTAIEGISGVKTKGGSGQSLYGDLQGLGEKNTVAITPGDAEADFVGTIDREAVRRRVRHYLYEVRGCFNRELNKLQRGQRLEGKVVIKWDIVEKGAAKNVQVESSTLNNPNVENCVRQRLANWSFPEPPAGTTAEVRFPFYFRPEQ